MSPLEPPALLHAPQLGLLGVVVLLAVGEIAGGASRRLGREWVVGARSTALAAVALLAPPLTACLGMALVAGVTVVARRRVEGVDAGTWAFHGLARLTPAVVAVGLGAAATDPSRDLTATLAAVLAAALVLGSVSGRGVGLLGTDMGPGQALQTLRASVSWVVAGALAGTTVAMLALALLTDGPSWRVVLLLPVLAIAVGTRRRLVEARAVRDRLDAVARFATDVAQATTVGDTLRRILRFSAHELRAQRAEIVFFLPGNKAIHAASLADGQMSLAEQRPPDSLRALVEDWHRVDLVVRTLGSGDAHPVRRWLTGAGIADAVIAPLSQPEPHGMLVVGNRREGRFDEADAELLSLLSAHGLEALLRVRRDELLTAQHRAVALEERPALFDWLTGLPNAAMLARHLEELDADEDLPGTVVMALEVVAPVDVPDEARGGLGAQITVEVGRRLLNGVRSSDLVACTGEGSFVVVMHDLAEMVLARPIAERLAAQVARPLAHGSATLRCRSHIGLAGWAGAESGVAILGHAHDALADARAVKTPGVVEHRTVAEADTPAVPRPSTRVLHR